MVLQMRGFRSQALVVCALCSLVVVAQAAAQSRSWAQPQIKRVVDRGLMAPSVATFRPNDPLAKSELAELLPALAPAPLATPTETTDTTATTTTTAEPA